jgi:hypothetical protein
MIRSLPGTEGHAGEHEKANSVALYRGTTRSYRWCVARGEPLSVERTRRQSLWIIGAMTIPAVVLGIFVAGITVAVLLFEAPSFGPASRTHLKPTVIAASACPYVALMHTAANNFQAAEPAFGFALDEHGNQLTWPQTRSRLDRSLKALAYSIRASTPHFPPEVQSQLVVAADAVREGRQQLAVATDGKDLSIRTSSVLNLGKEAFGSASDLVGDQCSVRLGADNITLGRT